MNTEKKRPSATILSLGRRISEIRAQQKLTQEELALETGLNRAYIGYIERGERNPFIDTVDKIAKGLKVELHELFRFEASK